VSKTIGVISDTHGLLRESVLEKLHGCDLIVHAGDVGNPSVLRRLRVIAEVVAVRGNVDRGVWAEELQELEYLEVEDTGICVIHDRDQLSVSALPTGTGVVIHGHSHVPRIERLGGVLLLNPGSAGPRRFDLPISMALLRIAAAGPAAELVELPAS
jgi:putative phosphoesterase